MIRKRPTVPEEAQKMIKTAATRAGMTVGEWLNAVILDAAADEGVRQLRHVFQDPDEISERANRDYASIYSRIDAIAAKIESLSQGRSDFEVPSPPADGAAPVDLAEQDAIFDQLSDLLELPAADDWDIERPRRKPASR
jgi:hypothetical protein